MKRLFLITLIVLLPLLAGAQADSSVVDVVAPLADYATPKRYIVGDIVVEGVQYQNPELLKSIIGLHVGDSATIPGPYITSAIEKLWNQRYFSDVKVLAQPMNGDSIRIEVYLSERQRVYQWLFDGVRKGEGTELGETLRLRRGSELSDYSLSRSIDVIKNHFIEKGFRHVTVAPRIQDDTTIRNAVNVTFVVDKGSRVRIKQITFTGDSVFTDARLRRALKKTHQPSIFFWKSTKFKEKEFAEDRENLIDFYNSKGYRNAHLLSDTLYDIDSKHIGLRIDLSEGNKYFIRDISWVGNSLYDTEQLKLMLGIEPGDAYDKKTLHKRLGIGREGNPEELSISSLYQNKGYLFSQIEPAETIIGADSIDLQIKIFEGKPATINEVTITGNMRVNDEVIRREIYIQPGELYDRSMIMATIRQLSQMQHFNPEAIVPDIQPVSNELVNVGFALEEKASDQFNVSGGWGAGMFVGSVGVQLNNVSVKNFLKGSHWRPYPQGQGQQLAISAQSNGTYYKSASLSFTEPWLGGRKPHSLTVSGYFSNQTTANWFYQASDERFRTIGVSVGLGQRLRWPDQYFTLYLEGGYQRYQMKNWQQQFLMTNGTANIFTLRTVFGRSTVDQPIFPRRGSDFSISLALTPPYSLFDGKDYADPNMSDRERYKLIEYHKWLLKAQWYFPLNQGEKTFVLMARAEMGYLGAYNPDKVSPFEGFDVGGDGMSGYNLYGVDVIGMRGYENSALNPSSYGYSRAYNKYTLELRFPFVLQPSSQIYGLVFAEGGNAFDSWQSFDPFQLKRSVGVGVRMYLPIVGMLGVDWGYGFDRAPGTNKRSGGHPHFMIGMQF